MGAGHMCSARTGADARRTGSGVCGSCPGALTTPAPLVLWRTRVQPS